MNTNNEINPSQILLFLSGVWKRSFLVTWSIALLCLFTDTFGLRTGQLVFETLGGKGQPVGMYWLWTSLALYFVWQVTARYTGENE